VDLVSQEEKKKRSVVVVTGAGPRVSRHPIPSSLRFFLFKLALLALAVASSACSPSRDSTTASRDVIAGDDAGVAPDQYVYVTQTKHGVIGLAEARGMSVDEARALVDKVASDGETCWAKLDAQGTLLPGSARIVALADTTGTVAGLNVKVSPGSEQTTLLCLVAPVRATNFPGALNAPQRGVAIEATWTKVGGKNAVDAGP
jgi:hypothetical protein